jgi:hypothetical protein
MAMVTVMAQRTTTTIMRMTLHMATTRTRAMATPTERADHV